MLATWCHRPSVGSLQPSNYIEINSERLIHEKQGPCEIKLQNSTLTNNNGAAIFMWQISSIRQPNAKENRSVLIRSLFLEGGSGGS